MTLLFEFDHTAGKKILGLTRHHLVEYKIYIGAGV